MSTLVSSVSQVIANIEGFKKELAGSSSLQERLAYARAWYAYPDGKGGWRFGPSKFVGYDGMTAAEYLDDGENDGRRTEKQLSQWFDVVPKGTTLHEELSAALNSFLDAYGKMPSTLVRFNLLKTEQPTVDNSSLIDLLVTVAKALPADDLALVRRRLAA